MGQFTINGVALTDEQLDSLRDALGPAIGMEFIRSGNMPTNGDPLEFSLSTEYERYHLAVYRFEKSDTDDLAFTFSQGATNFANENDYQIADWYFQSNQLDPTPSNTDLSDGFLDATGYLAFGDIPDFISDIWHNPGSSRHPYIKSEYKEYGDSPPNLNLVWNIIVCQCTGATGAVDKITIRRADPDVTWTGGRYVLWAVKS